jgi:hypothetical protein
VGGGRRRAADAAQADAKSADGRFALDAGGKSGDLHIVATGGRAVANAAGGENSAIALMTVLGGTATWSSTK